MKMLRAHWQIILAFIVIATAAILIAQKQAKQGCKVDTVAVQEKRLPPITIEKCN